MGLFGEKKPAEAGLIEQYTVIYRGGHPDYPEAKVAGIDFLVFNDRFEFRPTMSSKKWFSALVLPYGQVLDLKIAARNVSSFEGVFGAQNRHLQQDNNLHIRYLTAEGKEILLRVEMLTGVTVMGQAKKCQEFEDRLRVHDIRKLFRPATTLTIAVESPPDIPAQIERLAGLHAKGILTEAEFSSKKAELLAKL